MEIISKEFVHGGIIPKKFTCNGENINPELEFLDIQDNAVSLVLIVDDPDVPAELRDDRMFDHFVLFNIPPNSRILKESSVLGSVGLNTAGDLGYKGPCPPDTLHRYFFKLYALDTMLDLSDGATKQEVINAMSEHVLESAVIIGLYEQPDDKKTLKSVL